MIVVNNNVVGTICACDGIKGDIKTMENKQDNGLDVGGEVVFTDEQQKVVDAMVIKAKEGLFTQSDLDKKVTAEVDRRVESGIKKGIETAKSKWESEFKAKAEMTAEERIKSELDEKMKSIADREIDLSRKSNTLDAKNMFTEAGFNHADYSLFVENLVTDDPIKTKENIGEFIVNLNKTKAEIEDKLKKEMSIINKPQVGVNDNNEMTKEQFKKLGYEARLKLRNENKSLYDKLQKER